MQQITAQQLALVNDFMSNSYEFYTETEAIEVFTNEYGLTNVIANKILTFSSNFGTDPLFELQESDLTA